MKMKKMILVTLVVLFVGGLPLNGFAVELTLAHFGPTTHVSHTQGWVPWAKMVEDATKGQVKVTIYPAQTLVKAAETYDGVISGVTDIGVSYAGYMPGRFPLSEVINMPFLGFPSAEIGSRVIWQLYKEFPALQAEYKKAKVLFLFTNPPAQLSTVTKPVRKLEDIKGLVIRTTGATAPLYKALGASPNPMAFADTYSALEKGVVDGVGFDFGLISSLFKGIDFNHTVVNHFLGSYYVTMNLRQWNSLPPDVQKAIESVSGEKGAVHVARAYDSDVAPGLEYCKKNAKEFITLSPQEMEKWVKASKPVWDEWLMRVEKKGLPGKEILNRAIELGKKYAGQ